MEVCECHEFITTYRFLLQYNLPFQNLHMPLWIPEKGLLVSHTMKLAADIALLYTVCTWIESWSALSSPLQTWSIASFRG